MSVVRGAVENGQRVSVALPFYSGKAGIRDFGDLLELAIATALPPGDQAGKKGSVEQDQVEITKVAPSPLSKGFVIVSCRKLARA